MSDFASSAVASRDLRNHTSSVLERVQRGERVQITSHGKPVAELVPVESRKAPTISRNRLAAHLASLSPDPDLASLLDDLTADTTDDL